MNRPNDGPERARRRADMHGWKPRNCVWELTLACNLRCLHCGSRAGKAREDELSTASCLRVVDQLSDLGCELVTLSGGEPTLKKGWDTIAGAIAARGMYVNMVTNGVYRSVARAREVARRARDAGLCNVGVSIDGPREIHDRMRGPQSFDESMASVEELLAVGMKVSIMTTVSQLNLRHLPEVRRLAIEAGADQWRLQLAKPMGAMDDHRDVTLRPEQLLELIPLLARLKKAGGVDLRVGDSIGYYGPHDKTLRGRGWRGRKECWQGCQAGMQAIGIEANGAIKGCLSLQARIDGRDPFVEGNLRAESLADVWYRDGAFGYNRDFDLASLTGTCRRCGHAAICRGGSRCVAAAFGGTLGENQHCYHGVLLRRGGRRWLRVGQPAAAAAVLALSLGTGCGARSDLAGGADASAADAPIVPADSATPVPDSGPDCAVSCCPEDPGCTTLDYGVEPPPRDAGLPEADAGTDAGLDCSDVCCPDERGYPCVADDYGVEPPRPDDPRIEACCAVDPCAGACCDCDYGEPPPAECCGDA